MSGLGRRTHFRKHLTDSVLYDYPEPAANECIAKIIATRGSNQFDIRIAKSGNHQNIDSEGTETTGINQGIANNTSEGTELAILPTKFRKLIWLKRNDFVIVQYATDDTGSNDDNTTGNNNEIHIRIEPSLSSTDNSKVDNSDGKVSDDIRKRAAANVVVSKNSMGGGGIRYMITHILYKNQIQHLITAGLWPTSDPNFHDATTTTTTNGDMTTSTTTTTTDSDGIVFTKHKNDAKHVNCHDDVDDVVVVRSNNVNEDIDDDDGSYDSDNEEATDDDNDDDLFINTNRMAKIELQDSD